MKLSRIGLTLAIFLISILFVQAQVPKKLMKANEAFDAYEYYEAIDLYKQAYSNVKDKSLKAEIIFKTAECFRHINDTKNAELWYKKAIKVKYPDPVVLLYFGDALRMNGLYTDAIVEYEKYKELVPDDKRADVGIKSCELASKWQENPTRYEVDNVAFFNSKQNDYSPVFAKKNYDVIYFVSSREGSAGSKIHQGTGQSFSDIYESQQDRKGKWSEPVPLNEEINTDVEEGPATLDSKYRTMIFTRCGVEKKEHVGCKLLTATKKGVVWDVPEVIPIATDSFVVRHPSLSEDELTLYFSANLDGGYGSDDIWMVKRQKVRDAWGEPINLGPEINTANREMFPYIRPDGTLFFASDGHIGMGGLDIFKVEEDEKGNKSIVNLKSPINSMADDFGIIFEGDKERGFFSSNRDKGKGGDDIYSFNLPPLVFTLSGTIYNDKTKEELPLAKVKLIGSDGTELKIDADDKAAYKFNIKPNTDYIVVAEKEGFLNGKGQTTTKGLERSTDLVLDIYLTPIKEPIVLPNIYYDLDKWDLRPESMVALDKLVETLNDNPTIVIELMSHTDFRDSKSYNRTLSQKRAQSVVDYLIEKGINPDRLVAKGYGEEKPKKVSAEDAKPYRFLKEGQVLTEEFIKALSTVEEQEVAHQINRRTEFRVLRDDFGVEKK